jgi:hypothetical protein
VSQVDVDRLLDRHRDRFRRLVREIIAEELGEDPFRFPLDRYRSLNQEEKAELVERAGIIARDRIERELRERKAAWLIVVGDEVVVSSPDWCAVPSMEEVLSYGAPSGLVAFLFEAAIIEETSGHYWT